LRFSNGGADVQIKVPWARWTRYERVDESVWCADARIGNACAYRGERRSLMQSGGWNEKSDRFISWLWAVKSTMQIVAMEGRTSESRCFAVYIALYTASTVAIATEGRGSNIMTVFACVCVYVCICECGVFVWYTNTPLTSTKRLSELK
jgi:hypothetical protein